MNNSRSFKAHVIWLACSIIIISTAGYASDKYMIDKSIFGFYLGEHYESLNSRLEKMGHNKVSQGSNTFQYPLNNSKVAKDIIVNIDKEGYVSDIYVHFIDNSQDNLEAIKEAIIKKWGIKPQNKSLSQDIDMHKVIDILGHDYYFKTSFGSIKLDMVVPYYPRKSNNIIQRLFEKKPEYKAPFIQLHYDYETLDVIYLEDEDF